MRLLIIDDHALFREGLVSLIARDNPEATLLEAASLAEAQKLVSNNKQSFDFVLLDLKLNEIEVNQVTTKTIQMFPEIPIVVLSGEVDPRLIRSVIEAGAMGFIPKSLTFSDFSAALTRSLAGEVYLPQMGIKEGLSGLKRGSLPLHRDADSVTSAIERLSPRQLEILRLLVYGLNNCSIAKHLKISDGTVKTHLGNIFPLLGVHSRAEAVYLLAQVEHSIGRHSKTRKSDERIHDN